MSRLFITATIAAGAAAYSLSPAVRAIVSTAFTTLSTLAFIAKRAFERKNEEILYTHPVKANNLQNEVTNQHDKALNRINKISKQVDVSKVNPSILQAHAVHGENSAFVAPSEESQPWFRRIEWGVPRDTYCTIKSNERRGIIYYSLGQIGDKHPLELVSEILGGAFMGMKGVALIAGYLRTKKNLPGLYACTSFEAFQNKLDEISQLKEGRFAFVLPSSKEDREKEDTEYRGYDGHKLALGVEKTPSGVNIVILDAREDEIEEDDLENVKVSPLRVHSPAGKYGDSANETEALLWYIIHSKLYSPLTTHIYMSFVRRQSAGFGCETFSLRDSVWFLQDRDFFKKIQADEVVLEQRGISLTVKCITLLPPQFMRSTQSYKTLNKYFQEYPLVFPNQAEEIEALKKSLLKHQVEGQNHYIDRRSHKYHFLALMALLELDTKEIEKIIKEAGVVALCPPFVEGQSPQTLSEVALCNPANSPISATRIRARL